MSLVFTGLTEFFERLLFDYYSQRSGLGAVAASVACQPTKSPDLEINVEFTKNLVRNPSAPDYSSSVIQVIRIYSTVAIRPNKVLAAVLYMGFYLVA